jgi:hypothetical protein
MNTKCASCGADNIYGQISCKFCGARLSNSSNSNLFVEKQINDTYGWFTEMVSDNNGSRFFKSKNAVFPYPLFHKNNEIVLNIYYSESEIYFTISLSVKGYYSDSNFNFLRIKVLENDIQILILESNYIVSVVESKFSSAQWHLKNVTFKVLIDQNSLISLINLKNGKLILGDGNKYYDSILTRKLFVDFNPSSNFFILVGSYNSFYRQNIDSQFVLEKAEEIKKAMYFFKNYFNEYIYSYYYETNYPCFKNIEALNYDELSQAFLKMEFNAFKIYSDQNAKNIRDLLEMKRKADESTNENIRKNNKSCFIATATMGSYDHPVVVDLRLFRDEWLLKRKWGVQFTNWYYKNGPYLAELIEASIIRRKLVFYLIIKPLHFVIQLFKNNIND